MEETFEALIEGIMTQGYGTTGSFFDPDVVEGMRENLRRKHAGGVMQPAGVGKATTFQKNLSVRGDVISWIENDSSDLFEQQFFKQIDAFVQYLNRTCFTAINNYEFHYARYGPGSFYMRHLDQFQHDRGRKFSVVAYLNEDWGQDDGGELVLYLEQGEKVIRPEGGRIVFFKADETEHEVRPARRERLSIAGWLKNL